MTSLTFRYFRKIDLLHCTWHIQYVVQYYTVMTCHVINGENRECGERAAGTQKQWTANKPTVARAKYKGGGLGNEC
jgi:hypothetical protein